VSDHVFPRGFCAAICSVTIGRDRRPPGAAEAELKGLDEQALDRELAELVERLAAEPPELRACRKRRRPYRRRSVELVCIARRRLRLVAAQVRPCLRQPGQRTGRLR
jgi:hypothetical protein